MQADLFNVFNQTQLRFATRRWFTPPPGRFGQLNQAAPPRQIQLGARVSF